MDELDQRLAALESALGGLGIKIDPHLLDTAARSVQASIDAGETPDDAVRLGALELLAAVRCGFIKRSRGAATPRGA